MEAFAYHFNLRQLSNASAMWMGMNPPDIFLYIFLPPLLLDSAARIEFFMFRKVRFDAARLFNSFHLVTHV